MSLLAVALFLLLPAHAQESAAFLKIGPGARAHAMGGAHTALADDADAIAWNPAGLSRLARPQMGVTHAALPAGLRYDWVSYAQPTPYGTLGLGAIHLSQPTIESRDAAGRPAGGFSASDSAVALGYARRIESSLRLGGALKYIRSQLADASAQTFALDAAGGFDAGPFGLGLAVLNLGPGLRYLDETSPLPMTVAAGVAYRLPAGLALALDYKRHVHGQGSEVSVGTEYALWRGFAVRGGYGSAQRLRGTPLAALTAGFGLKLRGYSLDYAMAPAGEMGEVQRFSLGARF